VEAALQAFQGAVLAYLVTGDTTCTILTSMHTNRDPHGEP
jgi:hypothetical protein